MADLTANYPIRYYGEPVSMEVPCLASAEVFYEGALVFADATNGKAQASAELASGDFFMGISTHKQTVTAADQKVRIWVSGVFGFPVSGTTAATDMGMFLLVDASAITDNPEDLVTSDDATVATSDTVLGTIISVHDSLAWVNLGSNYPMYYSNATASNYAGFHLQSRT